MTDIEKLNLTELTDTEFLALQRKIEDAKVQRSNQRMSEMKAKIEAMLVVEGLTFQSLVEHYFPEVKKKSAKKLKVKAKFRHPSKPDTHWSGRGRQPLWFVEHVESGKSADDLLIEID